MARRVTSDRLVGRIGELAALRSAITAAGEGSSALVVVAGDAGIGKSRLIAEVVTEARAANFVVAVGGCVQLGEVSVAYAPLVQALRDLRAHLGDQEFIDLAGQGWNEIGALLGTRSGSASDSSGFLFENLLGLLTRLGQRDPVLLVLEDLHWADASTRDWIAFLGRNLPDAAVAVVLSYRSDELHRRHPLRPVIADLERDPLVERILLGGLARGDLARMLADICDEPPTAEVVDELYTRTEGNPFYVEEMIAAGAIHGGLPDSLANVILARVERLSSDAQGLLHNAAVLGMDVDDVQLGLITQRPAGTVSAALREAVFHQILVLDGDSCRFRHALIREALYDDLLPGEREDLHRVAALALEAGTRRDERSRWAQIAYHWYAATDAPRAFGASVRAGLEAEKVSALADAAEHFERALRLRGQVPDADAAAGMSRAELLLHAADAVQASSSTNRAIALAQAALDELRDAPPEQRSLVLERIGRSNWTQRHGPEAVAAYEESVAILEGRPPSREQAFALSALGQSMMVRQQYRDAEAVLTRAITIARTVGAPDVEGHALCSMGTALVALGGVQDGLAAVRQAHRLSTEFGTADEVCRAYVNEASSLLISGEYAEAVRVGAEGIRYAAKVGRPRHSESIAGNALAALICAGRWAEADRMRAAMPNSTAGPYLELRWLPLPLQRGDYDEARRLIQQCLDETKASGDVQFRAQALMRAGELAAAGQRLDDARQLFDDALQIAERTDDQFYRARALSFAMTVEAERSVFTPGSAQAAADRLADRLRAFTADVVARGTWLPEPHAWLATAEAEHDRVFGRDTGGAWATVVTAWEQVGQPFQIAEARYRQADALLREHGDRTVAATTARESLRIAEALGAVPLAEKIRQLARRGRLDLTTCQPTEPANPLAHFHLTPREVDVLRLLAEGQTNRQIGEALFISEKTASVHVTNVLRKLGVPSRLEAAAIAQRVEL
ncbi:AAA family ATPase [Kribbella sp. NPDC026611]|uniref:helix-turn-helix transcriptional regulator n=1 Tax=Kribbella sp. NPDC026611 TaxID=3154911 RepID=UPI0033D3034C